MADCFSTCWWKKFTRSYNLQNCHVILQQEIRVPPRKHGLLVLYSTYLKFLVSDGYDTTQETSNNQQYG